VPIWREQNSEGLGGRGHRPKVRGRGNRRFDRRWDLVEEEEALLPPGIPGMPAGRGHDFRGARERDVLGHPNPPTYENERQLAAGLTVGRWRLTEAFRHLTPAFRHGDALG
jgi:hypothetical protein